MNRMQSHVEEDKRKMQEQLEELWWEMEAFARKGTPVHEVEGHLFRKVLYLGFLLLGYFFRLLGAGDQGEQVKLEDGRVLQRLEGMHARSYWSVFGEFELFRHVYAEREKQAQEYIPLDARLPLPENSYSYLWQEWSQGLAVEFLFEQVTVVLGRCWVGTPGYRRWSGSIERWRRPPPSIGRRRPPNQRRKGSLWW